jgi:hypothetical protein
LIHEADPGLLDTKLIDDLSKARGEIASSAAKMAAVITAGVAYLVFITLDIQIPVSFSGITLTASPGVPEIAALIVAALSAAVAAKTVTSITLVVASKTLIRRLYPNELYALRMMQFHANEPPPFYRPTLGSLTWNRATLAANFAHLLILLVTVVVVIGLSIAWRWLVYSELWASPSGDPFWCRIAMITTFVIDLGWVVFIAFYLIPLPHKDFAWLDALMAVEKLPGWEWLATRMRADSYTDGWKDRKEMQRQGVLPTDPEDE